MRKVLQCLLPLLAIIPATLVFGETVVPAGSVSGTWTAAGAPYLIQGDIAIPAGSILTIGSGVEVNFQGHYKLVVEGALAALGTPEDSVVFTTDDEATGWHGIRISKSADSARMDYCIIEHGFTTGSAFNEFGGGMNCGSADAVITHCRFSDNRSYSGGGLCVNMDVGAAPPHHLRVHLQ